MLLELFDVAVMIQRPEDDGNEGDVEEPSPLHLSHIEAFVALNIVMWLQAVTMTCDLVATEIVTQIHCKM